MAMLASVNSDTFTQLVETNEFLTRKLLEDYGKNTKLLEIIKKLGGSPHPTQIETEADQKAKNWENWIKLCDPNGYFFSRRYEVTENHTRTSCNQKTENHAATITLNNATRRNTLRGSTMNKPTDNT